MESSINSIVVDKLRFTQIFFNLLSNAAKYTPEGGCVELTMESIPGIDNRVGMRFHIKDNGIGMSKEFQKVIFDPFTMENRPELSERKGSGLGLAIVKRIVDETGGKISIISEIGKGTEFIVDLYIYTESTTKQVESTPQYDLEVLKGIRVLVADDEPINAMILTKLLESKGCEVDRVSNGLEGVTAIQSSKPGYYDIILTDVRMPTMDGLEETRKIRALDRPDASLIPIIGTTADAYSEEEDKTKAAGMNTILVKPIDSKMLFDTVAKLVSQKQTM